MNPTKLVSAYTAARWKQAKHARRKTCPVCGALHDDRATVCRSCYLKNPPIVTSEHPKCLDCGRKVAGRGYASGLCRTCDKAWKQEILIRYREPGAPK